MKGYIYLITNLINNKLYIGQTITSIEERWNKHCSVARTNPHATGIDGAIRKYGAENFKIEEICNCDAEDLNELEKYYIKKYNTYQGNNADIGYNLTLGGQGALQYDINEEEMLLLYNEGMTAVELAKLYNCSDKTIGKRLQKYNIDTKAHIGTYMKNQNYWKENLAKSTHHFQEGDGAKSVYLVELDLLFDSEKECAQWLIDNHYSKASSMESARKSLSRCLNGERNSYCKMHFQFIERTKI